MATPTITLTPEQSMAALQRLLNGPAATPPAGVTPDFDDPPNQRLFVIAILVLCLTFSTLAVLMRMYTKLFLVRSLVPEDYTTVIGWLFQIAQAIPSVLTLRYGDTVHMWNVRLKVFFTFLKYVNLAGILYCPAIFFIKLSILLQYLRIFVPTRKGNMFMFVGVHVSIWICFICYSVSAAFLIAMCKPREKIWNPLMPGHCFSYIANYQATGIINVISDFTILILPVPGLWKLHLPLKRKLGLIAVFATGFFACITSVARVLNTWKFTSSSDISYNITGLGLWIWAELATGIVISCVPVLPKFIQHLAFKLPGLPTLGWNSRASFDHKSGSSGITRTIVITSEYEHPFGQTGGVDGTLVALNDACYPRAQLRREYIKFEENDKALSMGNRSGRQAGHAIGVSAPHTGGEV